MGIEEYHFLTKTMEQIESDSISLDEVKNDLKELDKKISTMEYTSRRNLEELNSFKKELDGQQKNLPVRDNIDGKSDSELRSEMKTKKESRKTILDFLSSGIIAYFVPWHGSTIEKIGMSPIPEVGKAEGQIAKIKASHDFRMEWAIDENYNRKKILENWDFGSIIIPWYLVYVLPFALVSTLILGAYIGIGLVLDDEENYLLSFCYDEHGNISNEEEVHYSEVNDGEVHCTYGGDERALNASEQEQLDEIEKQDSWLINSYLVMICLGPIIFPLLSVIYLRPKLGKVVELDVQINGLQSKLSVIYEEKRHQKKYESNVNSVPQREAKNAAHDKDLATERRNRDSMRVEIKDLEAKIQRLWESINHLIPYSSELDKN
jgi:hypothetical protein